MQENTIFVRSYQQQDKRLLINEREIWRYAGYRGVVDQMDAELKHTLDQVVQELKQKFSYKVCYRRMDIEWEGHMPVLPFPSSSQNLARCLKGSSQVVIFAATVGLEIDRYIARYQRLSPVKALMAQAYGAERIESLCDTFCDEIQDEVMKEGYCCSTRFSPGYGDLPLETQADIFRLLDCSKQIGISLNQSLLMTPSKSVTAIMGLGTRGMSTGTHKCRECNKKQCEYRKQEEE